MYVPNLRRQVRAKSTFVPNRDHILCKAHRHHYATYLIAYVKLLMRYVSLGDLDRKLAHLITNNSKQQVLP